MTSYNSKTDQQLSLIFKNKNTLIWKFPFISSLFWYNTIQYDPEIRCLTVALFQQQSAKVSVQARLVH